MYSAHDTRCVTAFGDIDIVFEIDMASFMNNCSSFTAGRTGRFNYVEYIHTGTMKPHMEMYIRILLI
jgi:hypothetical protein